MKVFISWSGPQSHEIAVALRDWLPTVLIGVVPWVSSEDIDKGARWTVELNRELDAARFGIICLVPGNVREPWVIFEAGAMSRSIETTRVAPLLVGAEIKDVPGPLGQFQCTVFEKEDIRKLVHSINRALGDLVERSRLDETFDRRWLELAERVRRIEPDPGSAASMTDHARAIVERVLPGEPPRLPEEQVKILTTLAKHSNVFPTAEMMARAISQTENRTQYHLDELATRGFINYRVVMGRPSTYYLKREGRAYVVENNLDGA